MTMASSTTMPIARISAKRVIRLTVKPIASIAAKAPMIVTVPSLPGPASPEILEEQRDHDQDEDASFEQRLVDRIGSTG